MRLPFGLPSPSLNLDLKLGRRSGGGELVGLDVQPGFVAAVKARVNGAILAERAAALPLGPDVVRDGEVSDVDALSEVLRELFDSSGLSKRVRVGIANQRTVLRTLELPPLTDQKELSTAVMFQAQDQVPMPLSNAVLDFHPLGIIDTPGGPRQRVVLVAAQRDMIERLLTAVRGAGLTPAGVDLAAFALIRSLYRPDPEGSSRVLYLNVDGLTNLAIAEGTVCRFTRVVGSGIEGIASALAVRRGVALDEARSLLAAVDLTADAYVEPQPAPVEHAEPVPAPAEPVAGAAPEPSPEPLTVEQQQAREAAMSYEEMSAVPAPQPEPAPEPSPAPAAPREARDGEAREALENGVREIAGEVRNSLDFHRSQEGGGEVSHVVLSGSAQDIPGFADALEHALGVEIRTEAVGLTDASLAGGVSTHRLAVAAGLAATEAPQ